MAVLREQILWWITELSPWCRILQTLVEYGAPRLLRCHVQILDRLNLRSIWKISRIILFSGTHSSADINKHLLQFLAFIYNIHAVQKPSLLSSSLFHRLTMTCIPVQFFNVALLKYFRGHHWDFSFINSLQTHAAASLVLQSAGEVSFK